MAAVLQTPALAYRESYVSYIAEFIAAGEPLIPFVLEFPTGDFQAFLDRLEGCKLGLEIAQGFVAHESFWLIDDTQRVVAVSNFRPTLTDQLRKHGGHIGFGVRPSERRRGYATAILRETLKKAKERGISQALLTCYKSNVGSATVIVRNGGVLDSEESMEGHPDIMQRYWVPTGG
jgi:predicted acetyltransferase